MPSQSTRWPGARAKFMIVGCGLIGGSIALAIRRRYGRATVIGVDRPSVLRLALERRIIDVGVSPRAYPRLLATEPPDAVVLATDVQTILAALPQVARACRSLPTGDRPLVMDVGSVKRAIVDEAARHGCPRFVGGHPMAGSERRGLQHAGADLLDGATFVLCPPHAAAKRDRRQAAAFVRAVGASPIVMDPELHDLCVAMVSHAPHIGAVALMHAARRLEHTLQDRPGTRGQPWKLAAGSWRDATRVAASDPTLWEPILRHNPAAICDALDLWIDGLQAVRDQVAAGRPALSGADGGLDGPALARLRRRISRNLPPT